MRTINGRVRKLEDQFWTGSGRQRILLILRHAGATLPDPDWCIQILDECGFLPTGPIGLVNLCQLPSGLNAGGLESYLRKDGAEVCRLRCTE
jgi:hypothetical protein